MSSDLKGYKFKFMPDPSVSALIVVFAASVDAARQMAAQYAAEHGLWGRWFWNVEPEVVLLNKPGVVAWAEFSR